VREKGDEKKYSPSVPAEGLLFIVGHNFDITLNL